MGIGAGILGLGAATATGGHAAAAAGTTTIALVAISGGFAAGTFATIDNSELAKIYTIAANHIDTALIEFDRQLRRDVSTQASKDAACSRALGSLKDALRCRNLWSPAAAQSRHGISARYCHARLSTVFS